MKYLSVCSGIESATVAWHPLGWSPVAFAEIEKFPSAVLAHHYPSVPNLGDMTKFKDWPDADVNVLVGGTPCQSFSVAGLRKGLADPRGNLALTYLALLDRYQPEWCIWENVPGVLSSGDGRDFGAFLGGLAELGYHGSYRVLDAQYVRVDGFARAVPQRRRRVFVVGHSGDWRRAAAVLFERESLLWNSAPRRQTGERVAKTITGGSGERGYGSPSGSGGGGVDLVSEVAPTISSRPTGGGGLGTDFDCDGGLIPSTGDVSHCLNAGGMGRQDYETETLVAQPICFDRSHITNPNDYTKMVPGGPAPALGARGGDHMVAHALRGEGFDASEDGTGRGTPLIPIDMRQASRGDKITNNRAHGSGGAPGHGIGELGDPAFTVSERGQAVAHPIAFSACDEGGDAQSGFTPTLRVGSGKKLGGGQQMAVAFAQNQREEVRLMEVAGALAAEPGMKQQTYIAAIQERAICENPNAGPDGAGVRDDGTAYTLEARTVPQAVAFDVRGREGGAQFEGPHDTANIRAASGGSSKSYVAHYQDSEFGCQEYDTAAIRAGRIPEHNMVLQTNWAVRRLLPVECEKLQGFPPGYTNVPFRGKPAADGPRYKALGNSMACNVMRWIGRRIEMVSKL